MATSAQPASLSHSNIMEYQEFSEFYLNATIYDHLKTKCTTTTTDIFVSQDRISLLCELDYPIAFRTFGWLVRWGIL
jgi:hypothetical protein